MSTFYSLLLDRVRNYLSNFDASHDISHILRVQNNALKLIEIEKERNPFLNEKIIRTACIIHDVGDFKYTKDSSIQNSHLQEIMDFSLPSVSTDNFLTNDEKQMIFNIVMNMSFRKELEGGQHPVCESIEFKIVQDADRLDAIGAIGLARCFVYSGARGRPIVGESFRTEHFSSSLPTAAEYNKATVQNTGDAVSHIYEKLLKLKDLMKTEGGKQIAEERHSFMVAFLKQFNKEC